MRRLLIERQAALTGDERRRYDYKANWLLPKLADLDGDVDAFIATVDPERRNAFLNAEVAKRLIAHSRADEALQWIDAPTDRGYNERTLADLRLAAFEQLGQKQKAQAQRHHIFGHWLDAKTLRAWLKALPAFEDFEAEQQALDLVVVHHDTALALDFLVQWPDLKRAATLVHRRLDALDGRRYEILRSAAEVLADDHPDAAALLYRLLVTAVLDRAAFKNYPYAARDYHAAAALADAIVENDIAAPHGDWVEVLRQRHGRKIGFWSIIEGKLSR